MSVPTVGMREGRACPHGPFKHSWTRLVSLGHAGYSSWAAYCHVEFDMGRDYSYKLLASARVVEALGESTFVDSPPRSESVARELVPVLRESPERVPEVWGEVALEAEERRTEVLIGELLGPAELGSNQHREGSHDGKALGVKHSDRQRFRALAAHADLVESLLSEGVTKRKPILDRQWSQSNTSSWVIQ